MSYRVYSGRYVALKKYESINDNWVLVFRRPRRIHVTVLQVKLTVSLIKSWLHFLFVKLIAQYLS